MLVDVVVDTNIFGHAQNPGLGVYFNEATAFLEALLASDTLVCIDGDSERSESRILNEYQKVISPTGLAAPVLVQLLTSGRFCDKDARVPPSIRIIINRLIRRTKAMDRLFLCVAYRSEECVLVTHDDEDFHDEIRQRAQQHLSVRVLEAVDCHTLL